MDNNRVYIRREHYLGADARIHGRWEVRYVNDNTLYAYAMTWWGAWRLACAAVGWKVPM